MMRDLAKKKKEADEGCNKYKFSATQLSVNITVASSEYATECLLLRSSDDALWKPSKEENNMA